MYSKELAKDLVVKIEELGRCMKAIPPSPPCEWEK
jgi:hypothetical protein